jgi:hypothetical protein
MGAPQTAQASEKADAPSAEETICPALDICIAEIL